MEDTSYRCMGPLSARSQGQQVSLLCIHTSLRVRHQAWSMAGSFTLCLKVLVGRSWLLR